MVRKALLCVLAGFFLCCGMAEMAMGVSAQTGNGMNKAPTPVAASRLPLYFEEIHGQTATDVRFMARASGYTAFLSNHETVVVHHNRKPDEKNVGYELSL